MGLPRPWPLHHPKSALSAVGGMHNAAANSCTGRFHLFFCACALSPLSFFSFSLLKFFLHNLNAAKCPLSGFSDLGADTGTSNTMLLVSAHEVFPLCKEPWGGQHGENQTLSGLHAGKE